MAVTFSSSKEIILSHNPPMCLSWRQLSRLKFFAVQVAQDTNIRRTIGIVGIVVEPTPGVYRAVSRLRMSKITPFFHAVDSSDILNQYVVLSQNKV